MSKNSKDSGTSAEKLESGLLEVKSKFDAEFRRFSIDKAKVTTFESFHRKVERIHSLKEIPFTICYTDPIHGDLLPINNDDNFRASLERSKLLLRLLVQRKGDDIGLVDGYGANLKKSGKLGKVVRTPAKKPLIHISMPEDFRRVSAIIDVDVVPETQRRVRLIKHGSDKPLGFYIRDGISVRVTPQGLEKVPGIFISRLVPGGLAEGTGLLAVNDEVLEVNGIEVAGKTLDQVTDMMVANSSNLIVTVKPVNQKFNTIPRGSPSRSSNVSSASYHSATQLLQSEDDDDEDEVKEYQQAEGGEEAEAAVVTL